MSHLGSPLSDVGTNTSGSNPRAFPISFLFPILRFLLSATWGLAAVGKLLTINQFDSVIESIIPLKGPYSQVLAFAIVAFEAFAAIGFLFRRTIPASSFISCILASAFAAVNLIKIAEGVGTQCGCFGQLFTIDPWAALLLNAAIFLASLCVSVQARPNGGNP